MFTALRTVSIVLFCAALSSSNAQQTEPGIRFIENKNQWSPDIDFSARLRGGVMNAAAGNFTFQFLDEKKLVENHLHRHEGIEPDGDDDIIRGHTVSVDFLGANANSHPVPFGKSEDYYNFYLGDDPSQWASKAFSYEGFLYADFYRGIALKVYSKGDHVKYDYIVAPGADPSQIAVQWSGQSDLRLDNGNLIATTSLAEIIEKRPEAWQFIDGEKKMVEVRYGLHGNVLTFCFDEGYDPCYELIVDPLLIFSTYSGSTADNWGSTATPGEHGTLYSAGVTNPYLGGIYPTTPGVFQRINGGDWDIGILKYDSLGQKLLYSTLIGGADAESPHSLVMNDNQELIVLGTTSSLNFPTTENAIDRTYNGGQNIDHVITFVRGSDIFIAKLSRDGTALLASTYLGGSNNDGLNTEEGQLVKNYGDHLRGDVIADSDGFIYVSSVTSSSNFALGAGFSSTYKGGSTDALVMKLSPDLDQIVWGSYLGGNDADASHTIKLDHENNIYVAGGTASGDFPTTENAFQRIFAGTVDGWIARIKNDGSEILNTTYTGTGLYDQIYFLDLNANDEVYVYGQTSSASFPMTAGIYGKAKSGQFLQKFSHDLSTRVFSTTFGSGRGTPDISPTAFLVNDCGFIYMSGWAGAGINSRVIGGVPTSTFGLEVSDDAFQKTTNGNDFYFIVLQDDAKKFLYGSFLGGRQSVTHVDGGTSRFDKGGTVYHAVCAGCAIGGLPKSDFPTTKGAWSRTNRSRNCNNAAFKFDLTSLKAILRTNSVKRDNPGLVHVCIPDKLLFENFSIGGARYEWSMGDGSEKVLTDTTAFAYQYKQTGTFLVKLKTIDEGTCKGIDSTSVYVTVDKIGSKVQDDADMCYNVPYRLKASGGVQYAWHTADNSFISSSANPIVNPQDTTMYFVSVTESTGCVKKDTVTLNVIPDIHPDFSLSRSSNCFDRPTLHLKNLTDSLIADDVLYFDFGDGATSDGQIVDHDYAEDGVYRVRLVAGRSICVNEKIFDVPVFTVKLPNVVTPGVKDGINDHLTIQLGDEEGRTPASFDLDVSLDVYDRWGRIVFSDHNYNYQWPDKDLAAGIYYYHVAIEGHEPCKSWIHIMK